MCKELGNEYEELEYKCDCDECEEEDIEQELFTKEELIEIIEEIKPKVMLNIESLNNLELDMDEFKRGIKESSYMCGQFIALTNVGMDKDMAYNVVLNESTARANLEMAEVQQPQNALLTMQNGI